MSEIEVVSSGVTTAFKGKKGLYLGIGVAAVVVVALVMKSSGSSGGGSVSGSSSDSSTAAGLASLGGSMQQSDAALQSHFDESNAALATGISEVAAQSTEQNAQIKTLQDQLNTALLNEQSIVGALGNLAAADTAQAKQQADSQTGLLASIAGLTTATTNLANNQTTMANNQANQNQSLLTSITNMIKSIPSVVSNGYNQSYTQPAPTPVVKTIFGASTDLASAMAKFGGQAGYNFVNTEGMDQGALATQLRLAGQNGLIVGGVNAGGGVSQAASNGTGVVRVAGNTAQDTAQLIQNIKF